MAVRIPFLIEYSWSKGRVITFCKFENTPLQEVADGRLEIKWDLHRRGIDPEVVLLDAGSGDAF